MVLRVHSLKRYQQSSSALGLYKYYCRHHQSAPQPHPVPPKCLLITYSSSRTHDVPLRKPSFPPRPTPSQETSPLPLPHHTRHLALLPSPSHRSHPRRQALLPHVPRRLPNHFCRATYSEPEPSVGTIGPDRWLPCCLRGM